ncbi:hypothetical protein [Nocardia sp. NPDC055049]
MLVLDFTERHVAVDFAALAEACGHSVREASLADGSGRVGMFDGLTPADVGELVAEAVAGVRATDPRAASLRGLDAELIELVTACMELPLSFARIAAGIRLLRRLYDPQRENVLSGSEIRRINELLDTVGSGEVAREELRFLGGLLGLLAEDRGFATDPGWAWDRTGLTVVTTGGSPRRKDLLDQLVFHRVLHAVRTGEYAKQRGVLVVAAADHLAVSGLESLDRHAQRAGVRLILLFEHLRGELAQLLGGAGSTSILMRLGNTGEAGAAADFVGRGHRFVLSQLTDQIGRSFTEGTSDTGGDSVTSTTTDGYSGSSVSVSEAVSRATTWSRTVSWSDSNSTSRSHTYTRAYEYAIEPTTFQSLPVTAFVLVESNGRHRRVVAGDCNPGIVLLDRVAGQPLNAYGGRQ